MFIDTLLKKKNDNFTSEHGRQLSESFGDFNAWAELRMQNTFTCDRSSYKFIPLTYSQYRGEVITLVPHIPEWKSIYRLRFNCESNRIHSSQWRGGGGGYEIWYTQSPFSCAREQCNYMREKRRYSMNNYTASCNKRSNNVTIISLNQSLWGKAQDISLIKLDGERVLTIFLRQKGKN